MDASAKPASGFMSGNNFWLGMHDQCKYVSNEFSIKLSDRYKRNMAPNLLEDTAPFEVEMRYAYVRHSSPYQVDFKIELENVLHLGLCLPKSCSNNQIHALLQEFFNGTDSRNNLDFNAEVLEVKDLTISTQFYTRTSLWLLVVCVMFVKLLSSLASNLEKVIKLDENNNIACGTENEVKLTFGKRIIKCFNYEENKKAIRSRESSPEAVNSISGMR